MPNNLGSGHASIFSVEENVEKPTEEETKNGHVHSNGHALQPMQDGPAVEIERDDLELKGTQSSLITIFSIWNAMMGTSLMGMPWAIKQAGFVNGIALLILMAGFMAYTAYRVITSGRHLKDSAITEFSDVVRIYLGRFAEGVAILCSVVTFMGAVIIYWILMSNFLYHFVIFIYDIVHGGTTVNNNTSDRFDDVICKYQNQSDTIEVPESFQSVWGETSTVPLFLCILVFPLINFKSPTFFTKFNALGIISVSYLFIFVVVKASKWGFHLNFDNQSKPSYTTNFELSFPATTGVAALAYFLHNAVMTIARNQRHPENNGRDLVIAYSLVCFTYAFLGALFYASFPLDKACVGDNLLDNLTSSDIMSFAARVGFFFQMTCVLPLIIYVIRTQLSQLIFGVLWPGLKTVLVFNVFVVTICVLFAVFLPNIGQIMSFVGAFCGTSYGIALPCLVHMVACHKRGTLSKSNVVFHSLLIAIGAVNFIAQFIIIGHTKE